MAQRTLKVNVERLIKFDLHFYTLYLQSVIANGNALINTHIENIPIGILDVSVQYEFDEQDIIKIENLIQQLVCHYNVEHLFDDCMLWYFVIADWYRRSEIEYSEAERARYYLSEILRLQRFKSMIDEKDMLKLTISTTSVNATNRKTAKLQIPSSNLMESNLIQDIVPEIIDQIINYIINRTWAPAIDLWLKNIDLSPIGIATALKELPKLKSSTTEYLKLTYATNSFLKYLHQKDAFAFSGNFFSHAESVFLKNYLGIFGFLPEHRKRNQDKLILELDLNFNNHMRRGIKLNKKYSELYNYL